MTLTKNKYYFEALDNYPYYLSDCLEALNYALSYDSEDSDSLCLMGRVYSEILKDYETAKSYFEEAMLHNVNNINTPKYYINCLISNEDYEEAQKLIEFSLKIKGIEKADILFCKAFLAEKKEKFKESLKSLQKAKKYSYTQCMVDFLESREKFVKAKMPKKEKKRKNKKKKETK